MNTIDQRILIPVSPESIWEIISNIEENKQWQVHCAKVSFLTTDRQGQGVRYRFSNPAGRDYVAEITAWYDNVGYAYQLIDGVNFRYNRGRIRLQEIAEGTIVQWVFEYEPGGILGGLRNTLGTRRQIENQVTESLRNLWRITSRDRTGEQYVSRTLMQEAPDAESRAQYKSRQPAPLITGQTEDEGDKLPAEPPVAEDDTRPRPATMPSPAEAEETLGTIADFEDDKAALNEPDFLSDVSHIAAASPVDPRHDAVDHATFQPPAESSPEAQTAPPTPPSTKRVEAEVAPDIPDDLFTPTIDDVTEDESGVTITEAKAEPTDEPIQQAESMPPVIPAPPADTTADVADEVTSDEDVPSSHPVDKRDTANISVFEIFGLPKPSETQQMRAITEADIKAAETNATPAASPPVTPQATRPSATEKQQSTVGWRLSTRRRLIKLRRR